MSSDEKTCPKIPVPMLPHVRCSLDHTNDVDVITTEPAPNNTGTESTDSLKLSTESLPPADLNFLRDVISAGAKQEKPDRKWVKRSNEFNERACIRERERGSTKSITSHPLVPSYRITARTIAIVLSGLIFWGIGKCLVSSREWTQLCGLVAAAEVVGLLVHSITALPPLLGMLLVGGAARNLNLMPDFHHHFLPFYVLRSTALVCLMIRTGFRLDTQRIRHLSGLLLGLATLPGIAECAAITIMSHYLLHMPVVWALLLGLVLAAACPSVIRPSFYLMGGGKGFDTLLLAAAGINDLVAITVLGMDLAVIFSNADDLPYQLMHRLIGSVGGLVFGCAYGIIARYIPEQNDPQVTELRTTMLVSMGLTVFIGAERIGLTGGGPIACMVAAMVSNWGWQKQGWSTKYNPVATTFDVFWRIMQPIMFLLIGAEVEIDKLAVSKQFLAVGAGMLICAWALRMCVSLLVTSCGNLTFKERIYVSLAWLPKADVQTSKNTKLRCEKIFKSANQDVYKIADAGHNLVVTLIFSNIFTSNGSEIARYGNTVQEIAALSPLALDLARRRDVTSDTFVKPALQCLMLVLLAVLLTAPLSAGLVAKRGLAPLLLKKEKSRSLQVPQSEIPTEANDNNPTHLETRLS